MNFDYGDNPPEITGRAAADSSVLSVTVQRACELSGLGRTSIWAFLKNGRLEAVRVPGVRRTLVGYNSLARLLAPPSELPLRRGAKVVASFAQNAADIGGESVNTAAIAAELDDVHPSLPQRGGRYPGAAEQQARRTSEHGPCVAGDGPAMRH